MKEIGIIMAMDFHKYAMSNLEGAIMTKNVFEKIEYYEKAIKYEQRSLHTLIEIGGFSRDEQILKESVENMKTRLLDLQKNAKPLTGVVKTGAEKALVRGKILSIEEPKLQK